MSAVSLNLSIDSILIKLLCRFVNFKEMKKKEIYKMTLKKIMKTFKSTASKIKTLRFFFLNKSPYVTLNKPPPSVPPRRGHA